MPDSLFDLEKRRSEVLAEISALGDFGPGSNFRHWGCGIPRLRQNAPKSSLSYCPRCFSIEGVQ